MNKEMIPYDKILSRKECLFAAFFSACSLFIGLDTKEPYESHISSSILNAFFELFEQAGDMFAGNGFYILVVSAAILVLYNKVFKIKADTDFSPRFVIGEKVIAVFFALMYTGGRAYRYNDTLACLLVPKFNIIKAVIIAVGFYYLYLAAIHLLYFLFEKRNDIVLPNGKFRECIDKFNVGQYFLFIFLMWLPHLIFRYPGALSSDNWKQLNEFFGYLPFITDQPVVHTVSVGLLAKLSVNIFGSANIGIFLYVLIQAAAMSYVLAQTLKLFSEWKMPAWFRMSVMFLYACTPYFMGNAAWAIKDYPHMIGYVLWGICFVKIVLEKKHAFSIVEDKKLIGCWIIGAVLMSLYRKNGLHIYVLACVIYCVISVIKEKSKKVVSMLLLFIVPLVLSVGIEKSVINIFNITEIQQQDAYSLLFQQTARYYYYHSDELTDEEREAIGDVLDLETLYDDYTVECSDNVKSGYHAENMQQMMRYFKVWFFMFFKHPECYVEATWNQNYYIFMPDFDNIVYNESCHTGNAIADPDLMEKLDVHVPTQIQGFAVFICSMYRFLNKLPLISTLNNLCVYVFMMFAISFFMKSKKKTYYSIAMLPLWLSLLFIVLAPMIVDQPRYSWAIFYLMPMMMALYMHLLDGERSHE